MTVSATFVEFYFLILQLLDYTMKIIGRDMMLMSPVFSSLVPAWVFIFVCQIVTVSGRKFILFVMFIRTVFTATTHNTAQCFGNYLFMSSGEAKTETGSFQHVVLMWCCVTVGKVLIIVTDETYVKPLSEIYAIQVLFLFV